MIGGVDWFGVDPLAAGPLVVWLVSCLVAGLVTGALSSSEKHSTSMSR